MHKIFCYLDFIKIWNSYLINILVLNYTALCKGLGLIRTFGSWCTSISKNFLYHVLSISYLIPHLFFIYNSMTIKIILSWVCPTTFTPSRIGEKWSFTNGVSILENDVVLRGCSSRRKMFHVECESHLSGLNNEQICYCSFDLCNELNSEQTLWRNLDRKVITVILLNFVMFFT